MATVLPPGARKVHQQGSTFYVVGDERQLLRDAYHTFLRLSWWGSFGLIAVAFFFANVVFAAAFMLTDGVAGGGGWFDALSFSVQTMGTIGYGVLHPVGYWANILVIIESIVGIIVTALVTGLVFAKFSRPTTRVAFSKSVVVRQHEGKPTLMLRVGNRRSNVIVEATLHVVAIVTAITAEGETFYRAHDLKLVRDRQVGMTRGWTVMHVIDEHSPLFGMDEAALRKAEVELFLALTGIDDVTAQTVHAMHHYVEDDIKFGHKFADTLMPLPDGTFYVDLRNFDVIVPDPASHVSVPA